MIWNIRSRVTKGYKSTVALDGKVTAYLDRLSEDVFKIGMGETTKMAITEDLTRSEDPKIRISEDLTKSYDNSVSKQFFFGRGCL